METETKNYEVAYLISPDVSEEGVFGVAGKITSLVQNANGIINRIEEPKKIRLAYPIAKQKNAYFGWTTFSLAPENLENFKKKLKTEEKSIIRFLITTMPKKVPQPRHYFAPSIKPKREKPALWTKPAPGRPDEKEKMDIQEIDKKLEEILGR